MCTVYYSTIHFYPTLGQTIVTKRVAAASISRQRWLRIADTVYCTANRSTLRSLYCSISHSTARSFYHSISCSKTHLFKTRLTANQFCSPRTPSSNPRLNHGLCQTPLLPPNTYGLDLSFHHRFPLK